MRQCKTCDFFVDQQPGRPKGKGLCYCYPTAERKTSNHWCGQYRPKDEIDVSSLAAADPEQQGPLSRQQLMKALKAAGKKVDVKMSREQMQAALDGQEPVEVPMQDIIDE